MIYGRYCGRQGVLWRRVVQGGARADAAIDRGGPTSVPLANWRPPALPHYTATLPQWRPHLPPRFPLVLMSQLCLGDVTWLTLYWPTLPRDAALIGEDCVVVCRQTAARSPTLCMPFCSHLKLTPESGPCHQQPAHHPSLSCNPSSSCRGSLRAPSWSRARHARQQFHCHGFT